MKQNIAPIYKGYYILLNEDGTHYKIINQQDYEIIKKNI